MPYHPSLSKNPITVHALWDGQIVEVRGWQMRFDRKPNSDKVFLTLDVNSTGQSLTYPQAWDRYMRGVVGCTNSAPIYDQYHHHVRKGPLASVPGLAEFTRAELVEVLASGNYYIG